jgi:tetratricopeptide (TPR) repeat protein
VPCCCAPATRAAALDEVSAEKSFARALQLAPSQARREGARQLYERLADPERARTRQAAADAGGVTPARMLGVANATRTLRDFERSQAAYAQALDDVETGQDAARGLGQVFNETGRSADAIGVLEKAVSLAPRDAGLKRELAVALHATGQGDRALELLGASEQLAPHDAAGFRMQAVILRERGDAQGARQRLEKAIELDPVDGALRAELAGVHDLLGDGAAAALEREHAQLLAVAAPETQVADSSATATRDAAPASRDLTGIDTDLLGLVQSFGAMESEVGRVALLGVREPPRPLRRPATWLKLRAPSAKRTDAALARAVGGLYDVMPRDELGARSRTSPTSRS